MHIRPQPVGAPSLSSRSSSIEKWLAPGGCRVEACGDVYRALARLGRRRGPGTNVSDVSAVLLDVDALASDEFEFIPLLSQVRRQLPVYVYSSLGSAEYVAQALRAGAAGEATEAVVRALLRGGESAASPGPAAIAPTPPRCEPLAPATEDVPRFGMAASPLARVIETSTGSSAPVAAPPVEIPVGQVLPAEIEVEEEEDEDDTEEFPPDDDSKDPPRVRVPWSRPGEGASRRVPVRRPPPPLSPASKPGSPGGASVPAGTEPTVGHTPLLTPEELRALLGDDVAALAPSGREAPPPPLEPRSGKGARG